MKIAVIGAGVFGCVAAIKLYREGHDVDLYDLKPDILQCASGINQYRLHRGYHYPRSVDTATQSIRGIESFVSEYGDCLLPESINHYYAISERDSFVTALQYQQFLDRVGLPYTRVDMPEIKNCSAVYRVEEDSIDIQLLRQIIAKQLANVRLIRGKCENTDQYEKIVNATYANINEILPETERITFQFELCEKPIFKMPDWFSDKSIVIMDGPFGCVDPYISSGFHLAGHVEHAIHCANVGHFAKIPALYESIINSGTVNYFLHSKYKLFLSALKEYLPVDGSAYIGSMYTIRTVLPSHDHDDARPSFIINHDDRIYTIFSGKIGTCVDVANDLINLL